MDKKKVYLFIDESGDASFFMQKEINCLLELKGFSHYYC